MDYKPNGYRRARAVLEKVFKEMDRESRKGMTKNEKVKGLELNFWKNIK